MSRTDLIANAVAFLADPKIQAAAVTKRIQFLEEKGLTNAEIDDAIRQAAIASPSPPASIASHPMHQPLASHFVLQRQLAPAVPQLDWRDYFIMAVVSGGLMFGAFSLARKYLWPHMQPPSQTAYEGDRDALAAQFDAVAALVAELHADGQAARADIARATEDVEAAVRETRAAEARATNELREIRAEVDTIREMLPKMMDKTRDAQAQSLAELKQELASLKALLLTLGPSASGAASPALPFALPRASIPSWQLGSSSPGARSALATPANAPEKPASEHGAEANGS